MIFNELILHDFGVFGGRVAIDLTPKDTSRPVILFGGLNGRGKTTILDAIQIALFGQRATISNRGNLSWDDYLRRTIHRSGANETSISLEFELSTEDGNQSYRIVRSWEAKEKSVKESFGVVFNGSLDKLLSTQWDEHIETILPARIATLNFFDGEKIESLADPLKSSEVIGSAIDNLLGVGLLNKLTADLKTYIRRTSTDVVDVSANQELDVIDQDLQILDQELAEIDKMKSLRAAQLHVISAQLAEIDAQAITFGSDQWSRRDALEKQKQEIQANSREHEDSLLIAASGSEPLKLIKDLIEQTLNQAIKDTKTLIERQVVEVLANRDSLVLDLLEQSNRSKVEQFLESDRELRHQKAHEELVFGSPDLIVGQISQLADELVASSNVQDQLNFVFESERQILEIDRVLATVPTDDVIIPLIKEQAAKRAEFEIAQRELDSVTEGFDAKVGLIERTRAKYNRLLEVEAEQRIKDLDLRRAREFAQKAINTVAELAARTMQQNINSIELSILEKLTFLMGKENLINDLRIDPQNLQVLITTGDDVDLPVDRLSAGERQLLAIATLWGLATVSGHPLPLVIDTPLGRLDSEHRRKLVTNYFPNASEQVLILSTDEEIDTELHALLKDSISHQYILEYDDSISSTSVRPGYFTETKNGR